MQLPAIELVSGRIHLRTPRVPYGDDAAFEEMKRLCKSVQGHSWNKTHKAWTYPLAWYSCTDLRRVWGTQLSIGPALTAWAIEEKQRRERIAAIAGQEGADVDRVRTLFPVLAEAMSTRTYQQVGAAWLASSRCGLLGDQPGLGKTLQSIGAVLESGIDGPNLVIAPATAVDLTWEPELHRWVPGDAVFACCGGRVRREKTIAAFLAAPGRKWLVCNPEMFRLKDGYTQLHDVEWASIIADESHQMLITRTGAIYKQAARRQGLGRLKVAEGGLRIAMSGTPFRGKLENLWGTLNWLYPERYRSYWTWVEHWFEVYDDAAGRGRIIDGLKIHRKPEFYAELDSVMLRRTKKDAAPDLPPKFYAGNGAIWLDMEPEQARIYKDMRQRALVELDGGELQADGVLAVLTRLKQFATTAGRLDDEGNFVPETPSNKLKWLLNWLSERDADQKVIVASQFSSVIDLFETALIEAGVQVTKITGDVSKARRATAKRSFQEDGAPQVMLLTTTAGGVSLTLDAADDVIFLDQTWVPDDQEQVEDRAHRVSRMHQVTIWYLGSTGTIEHKIHNDNRAADAVQKFALDGRRAKELI
jgi:SNF2 family DNA or RNA helicase